MRIIYGVHGYGQGHATRALALLHEFTRRHEVTILAGGDAYEALHREYPVVRLPTLHFSYRRGGTVSHLLTFKENISGLLDLVLRGPTSQMVEEVFRGVEPHVVISDAEPWTHRVAARLGVFRIGFDHFGVMAYCRPPLNWRDRILSRRDACIYRFLMGQPDRVLVSSFYDAPAARPGVRVVGTLLRREVFDVAPAEGAHLLAYFNKGQHLFSRRIERALRGLRAPVIVYGTRRLGTDGNLEFRPPGNRAFLEALATCRAVISTAGNQLVGEAIYFRKPMLVMPEDSVEQRMNATAIEKLGIGVWVSRHRINRRHIRDFLARAADYRAAMEHVARDGRREALETIAAFFDEAPRKPETPSAEQSVA